VRLESGREHDINELSSGEKEVLLGYLRLRNSAPRNSIILVDEPELHLNPRLIRGLPQFYQKHIGLALDNQLWLITHSDTLLREAVEEPAYAVFHMEPSHLVGPSGNQAHPVSATAEIERALMDLVGDLATFSPRSRVVLLEGGGDAEFDVNLVQRLFPQFSERTTLIPGGSKRRVREMHDLLDAAAREGKFRTKFYSVVDRDFDGPDAAIAERRFAWDVYHVENYLIEPRFLKEVVASLELSMKPLTEEQIEDILRSCASQCIDTLVKIQMRSFVNGALVRCIDTNFDPAMQPSVGFRTAVERSRSALNIAVEGTLRTELLEDMQEKIQTTLGQALIDGRWKAEFRGRDVLQRFTQKVGLQVPYEQLRNLIASRMSEHGHQPPGMKRIIDAILQD
jgi:hypothetical protein